MTAVEIFAVVMVGLLIVSVATGLFLVRMEKRKGWYHEYVERVWNK